MFMQSVKLVSVLPIIIQNINSEKSIYYMNLFKAYSDSVQDMRATQVVADIDAKYNMKKNEERIS